MEFPDPETTTEIDVETVAVLKNDADMPEFVLVDCREQDEHDFCRIDGARLIPLSQFANLAAVSLTERDKPVIVYCHHGMRSLQATQFLRSRGFEKTFSMSGGIDSWSLRIDPEVPRY